MGKRVVLAMSGGVDSSVAAVLLKAQGYEVIGIFMRTGAAAKMSSAGPRPVAAWPTRSMPSNVADRLDIPFYALDFERDFARIEDYFADEYLAGRTPNPCVMCNIWLKFGKLWAYGKQVGADFVATGHYARMPAGRRTEASESRGRLDRAKDQSYVLFGLQTRAVAARAVSGRRVLRSPRSGRSLASTACRSTTSRTARRSASFPTTITLGSCASGIPDHETAGAIVDQDGTVLGEHSGIEAFTIGQRRGLGIALGSPRYVVQIEPATRTVTVGARSRSRKPGLTAARFNWQGTGAGGTRSVSGPDSCPASGRAGDRLSALDGDRARVMFGTPADGNRPRPGRDRLPG